MQGFTPAANPSTCYAQVLSVIIAMLLLKA